MTNPQGAVAGSNLKFVPGENNIVAARFSPSVVLFWLRVDMAATNRRVVLRFPNTLFGFIPLGYSDTAIPLNNVASVGADVRFLLRRAVAGLIFLILGFALLSKVPFLGIIFVLFGIVDIATCFPASLVVQNNAGSTSYFNVSIFQKAALEQFRDQVNSRVFADYEGQRHNEAMGVHQSNLQLQQQQLDALRVGFAQQQQQPQQQIPNGSAHPGVEAVQHQQVAPAPHVTQPMPQQPVQYQVGDIVNGHRFNGQEWIPVS